MDSRCAASDRPYTIAPFVQANIVQVLCHFQGSSGVLGIAPCSELLPARCAKKVRAFSLLVSTLHVWPLPMKCVDDNPNDDAKEASFDEEGTDPKVNRLHIESLEKGS